MIGELHLPDLPEVPVALSPLGGPPDGDERRKRPRWSTRLRETMTGYLPLLLMTLLALGTWLIAKNTPGLLKASVPVALRHEPDYTLDHFTSQRFDPTGKLKLEITGDQLRHFPDDDMVEVDNIHVVSTDDDGRKMTATAAYGRATGDSSQVWLDGHAQIVSEIAGEAPIQMNGEHLRAEPQAKRMDSDSPVLVQQGGSSFNAQGMVYEGDTRVLTLKGNAHVLMQPSLRAAASAKK